MRGWELDLFAALDVFVDHDFIDRDIVGYRVLEESTKVYVGHDVLQGSFEVSNAGFFFDSIHNVSNDVIFDGNFFRLQPELIQNGGQQVLLRDLHFVVHIVVFRMNCDHTIL